MAIQDNGVCNGMQAVKLTVTSHFLAALPFAVFVNYSEIDCVVTLSAAITECFTRHNSNRNRIL